MLLVVVRKGYIDKIAVKIRQAQVGKKNRPFCESIATIRQ